MLDDGRVPVTVDVGPDRIRLTTGETEIGTWPSGDFTIVEDGGGRFRIEAENDSLAFLPDDPGAFAATVVEEETGGLTGDEGGPPRRVTLTAFYALAFVTTALGLWALLSLIF